MNMMTIEEIRELANNPTMRLTNALKQQLTGTAKELKIAVPTCKCRNKWFDLIILIYRAMRAIHNASEVVSSADAKKRPFKCIKELLLHGNKYNDKTPLEKLYYIMARYPRQFWSCFVRVEQFTKEEEKASQIASNSVVEQSNDDMVEFYEEGRAGIIKQEIKEEVDNASDNND